MSFGTINATTPRPTTGTLAAAGYFVAINQLSAHNAPQTREETVQSSPLADLWPFSPLLPYAPFVLFILLFVVTFGIQLIKSIRNTRQVISALMIAIFAASIPTVLTYIQQGTRQEARAGPEEIPRMVQVQRNAPGSVSITWKTDAMEIGVVKLGEAPYSDTTARVYLADNQQTEQTHTAVVSGLKDKHTYEFEILSGKTWYDNGGKYIQFTFLNSAP